MGCCCKIFKILALVSLGIIFYLVYKLNQTTNLPVLEENPWWAAGEAEKEDIRIFPYKLKISERVKLNLIQILN